MGLCIEPWLVEEDNNQDESIKSYNVRAHESSATELTSSYNASRKKAFKSFRQENHALC